MLVDTADLGQRFEFAYRRDDNANVAALKKGIATERDAREIWLYWPIEANDFQRSVPQRLRENNEACFRACVDEPVFRWIGYHATFVFFASRESKHSRESKRYSRIG